MTEEVGRGTTMTEEECIHGLVESWCAVCRGTLTYGAPTTLLPPETLCCSPGCKKEWNTRLGPLPLCEVHQLHVERHIVMNWRSYRAITHNYDLAERYEAKQFENELKKVRQEGWVYFVMIDDHLKIGHSVNVNNRIRSFGSYGQRVEVVSLESGGRALEARLHRRFDSHRAQVGFSKEMFVPSPEILTYIDDERTCYECNRSAMASRVVCDAHSELAFEEEELIGRVIAHGGEG